jgi:hypothetical protein
MAAGGAAMNEFAGPESLLFVFLAVGAVALFSMISVAVWSESRRKEREAYYRNDMLKRVAESQGPGAAAALTMMQEEARLDWVWWFSCACCWVRTREFICAG